MCTDVYIGVYCIQMQAQHLPHAAAAAAAAASLGVPSIPMPPYPSNLAGSASASVSGAAGLLGLAAAAGAAPSSLMTPSSSHFHAIKDDKGASLTQHLYKRKGKVDHTPQESIGGCSSPSPRP